MTENDSSSVKSLCLLGAGGFIGSHLVRQLVSTQNYDITCIDLTDDRLRRLASHGSYRFIRCDVRESPQIVREAIESADVVVDLVAHANPSLYLEKPIEVVQLNLIENVRIAEMCMASGKWLIQFSTSEVYGKANGRELPFNEETSDLVVGPINKQRWIYSSAKQLLERMIYAWGADDRIDYTIVRPFNIIGPEMDYITPPGAKGKHRVFPEFMSALIFEKPLRLINGGNTRRCFTYIDDAIAAISAILHQPNAACKQIYNIGAPGNEVSIRDLANLMIELYHDITGRAPASRPEIISGESYYGKGYEDCDRRVPDISKIEALGWTPQTNLLDTIRESMIYYIGKGSHCFLNPLSEGQRHWSSKHLDY